MQHAAAVAFSEPTEVADRIARSRSLHAVVCQEAARICIAAGLDLAPPQAAFYLYPDFAPWRRHLSTKFGVVTGADLASLLLNRYGAGTLPASAFGEEPSALRLRLATGLLYGDTDDQREAALASHRPARAALDRRGLAPARRDPRRSSALAAGGAEQLASHPDGLAPPNRTTDLASGAA